MNVRKKIRIIFLSVALAGCVIFCGGCVGGNGNGGGCALNIGHLPVYETCEGQSTTSNKSFGQAWTCPGGAQGQVIDIPDKYKPNIMKYEGYSTNQRQHCWMGDCRGCTTAHEILVGWGTGTAACMWWDAGKQTDDTGLAMINGRYCVAMKKMWGNVGDLVDAKLENGNVIPCIITDEKGGESGDEWCHGNTPGDYNFLEFFVCTDNGYDYMTHDNPGCGSCHKDDWGTPNRTTVQICAYGAVDWQGGGSANKCATTDNGGMYDYLVEAKRMADDNNIGYSQSTRFLNPNVDCSSFVSYSLQHTGYNVKMTFTGSMKEDFKEEFDVVNYSKSDLKVGDILLAHRKEGKQHTEFVWSINGDQIETIGAHSNSDGKDGDSSGTEVCVVPFVDDWDWILHPKNPHSGGGSSKKSKIMWPGISSLALIDSMIYRDFNDTYNIPFIKEYNINFRKKDKFFKIYR